MVNMHQDVGAGAFGLPQLGAFFFSVRKGLFVWFPVFVPALFGLFLMERAVKNARVAVLILLAAQVLVISSYSLWQAADGLGNRFVVDMVAFVAFPLAALITRIPGRLRWAVADRPIGRRNTPRTAC